MKFDLFNLKLDFFPSPILQAIVWFNLGFMVLTLTHGIDLQTWYRAFKVQTWNHGIDLDLVQNWIHDIQKDSWYKLKLMVQTWTHGINKDSLYRLRLMVQNRYSCITHVPEGPSVTHMRDFLCIFGEFYAHLMASLIIQIVFYCILSLTLISHKGTAYTVRPWIF